MKQPFSLIKAQECDAILILPSIDKPDETNIQGLTYKEPGDKVGGNEMGDLFDIVSFRQTGEEQFGDLDSFQAILVCPYTYTEKMFEDGYLGLVARCTTTSKEMVERVTMRIGELIASN